MEKTQGIAAVPQLLPMRHFLRRFQAELETFRRRFPPVLDRLRARDAVKGVIDFRAGETLRIIRKHFARGQVLRVECPLPFRVLKTRSANPEIHRQTELLARGRSLGNIALQNHYEVLGLSRRCTAAEVRGAYRLLVRQHHPDLNNQAPEAIARSQELNEAHEILSDPAKRREYDRTLEGNRAGPRGGRIERNISQEVNLRLEDFFRGASLEVTVKDPVNSLGAESYQLQVPPMTAPGARFRLPRAAPCEGGFVDLRLRALPGFRFKARGSDLRCDLRISAERATKGGIENMAGPTGAQIRLAIPARTARGEILRVSGEGLPRPRGGRGDLLVRITYRPDVRVTRTR